MEKRVPLIFLLFLLPFALYAQFQEPSPMLRIQLWVPAEDVPSQNVAATSDEPFYAQAVRNLKDIAPFMLEGMLYGWNVTYTPADSARHVEEYYECTPIREVDAADPAIQWAESEMSDAAISCWLNYERTPAQMQYRKWWNSVNIIRVQGKGSASVTEGTEGLKQAVIDAAKKAILAYLRKTQKNKPEEMTGSIMLADETPRIYIDHGQYTADLDFFLYVDKIEQYSYY